MVAREGDEGGSESEDRVEGPEHESDAEELLGLLEDENEDFHGSRERSRDLAEKAGENCGHGTGGLFVKGVLTEDGEAHEAEEETGDEQDEVIEGSEVSGVIGGFLAGYELEDEVIRVASNAGKDCLAAENSLVVHGVDTSEKTNFGCVLGYPEDLHGLEHVVDGREDPVDRPRDVGDEGKQIGNQWCQGETERAGAVVDEAGVVEHFAAARKDGRGGERLHDGGGTGTGDGGHRSPVVGWSDGIGYAGKLLVEVSVRKAVDGIGNALESGTFGDRRARRVGGRDGLRDVLGPYATIVAVLVAKARRTAGIL